jgi:hypothetical protein
MSFFGLHQTQFMQKAVLEADYLVYFDFFIAYFSRLMYNIASMGLHEFLLILFVYKFNVMNEQIKLKLLYISHYAPSLY